MLLEALLRKRNLIVLSLILAVLTAAIIWSAVLLNRKTFYEGIYIEDINISGLTREQVEELIIDKINTVFSKQKLELVDGDQSWKVGHNDLKINFNTNEAIERAYQIGRHGNIFNRLVSIFTARQENVHIKVYTDYDRNRLKKIMLSLKDKIDVKEQDAQVEYKDGSFKFDKEVIGRSLDIDRNISLVENRILSRNFNTVELEVLESVPRILYDNIKEINDVLASFSTTFNTGDKNRTHNIKLACERINNTLLLSGDVFSMNEELGTRTIENGYKDAPVIYKNELVPGAGGGVCQVTTTLYDSVLLSRLQVLERTNHSLPLGYVKPGQDATIAEGYIDFKFMNSREYPVLVNAEVKGKTLLVRVLGRKDIDEPVVKLRSQVVEEYLPGKEELIIDDSLADGERIVVREAKKGLKAVVYRETYNQKGELIESEKISEDVYKPVKGQVKVNANYSDKTDTQDE